MTLSLFDKKTLTLLLRDIRSKVTRKKAMMISDLPPELESEILSRVPSKSLVQLKTTCKRWYTLFNDPIFIKKKLGKAGAMEEEEVILLMSGTAYSISFNLHGSVVVDPIVEFTGKLSTQKLSQIFHCDGLIFCITEEYDPKLVVWNPCTGQTLEIKPNDCYENFDFYALGYGIESSCPSYKILRFGFCDRGHPDTYVESEIYDFSTESWRVVDGELSGKWCLVGPAVSLGGNSYWTASDDETDFFSIILFDFAVERFECLPLPFQTPVCEYSLVLSVVGGEKLALLHQQEVDSDSLEVEIWITNKVGAAKELSWSKLLVVDFNQYVFSFLLDEERKVAVCCSRRTEVDARNKIYVVGEGMHKQVYKEITEESGALMPILVRYVPSLAHIPKSTKRKSKKRRMKQRKG